MKIEQLKTKIAEQTKKIDDLKEQLMNELRKDFHGALVELFDEYPFVKAVHFTAYTPYFADGDECTYSSHHDYCGFNGYNEGDSEESKCQCTKGAFGDIEGDNILYLSKENIYVEVPNPKYDPKSTSWSNSPTKWENAPNPNFNALHKKAVDDFRAALQAVSDDNWKELVGDHCIVMIDRKGIHVEEYNHD